MCGIAGIIDFDTPPRRDELQPMVDVMIHRGPDSDGVLVEGPVALGMRRLSIIDLDTGDQPIYNEDGSLVVFFNGEIYNYIELREQLRAAGHRFKTKGDTEVLPHLYEEHGIGMLAALNGMFGFALWDSRKRAVFLVRDRMGIKPLYVARAGTRLYVASEIKALLRQPALDRTLDRDALADYLKLGYIPQDATPFKAIRKVRPGHYLRVSRERIDETRWWDLNDVYRQAPYTEPLDHLEELADLFDDAVRLRMRSDVPVASFLSGGVDSSLITVKAQAQSPLPLRTYTVGYFDTKFDETGFAQSVADQAGTRHSQVRVAPEDLYTYFPRLVWHMDEPITDVTMLPHFMISRLAAQDVKVCLSGLGGDELFGGYPRYADAGPGRIRRAFRHMPGVAGTLARFVKVASTDRAHELEYASDPSLLWRSHLRKVTLFDNEALARLGLPGKGRVDHLFETLWNGFAGVDAVGKRQYIDQHTYLPDLILALTDRMSMAVSLENRVPFLDHRLVRLTARVPGCLKQTLDGSHKQFLKQALGETIPEAIRTRPKFGFSPPLTRWLAYAEMRPLVEQLPERLAPVLNPTFIRTFINREDTIRRRPFLVWALMVLHVWLSVVEKDAPPEGDLRAYFGKV